MITYRPLKEYMKQHHISYYYLANQGMDNQTLHRIRHDKPVTTETLEKLCAILKCQPSQLIEYTEDKNG